VRKVKILAKLFQRRPFPWVNLNLSLYVFSQVTEVEIEAEVERAAKHEKKGE
jgi:hypothetical protein